MAYLSRHDLLAMGFHYLGKDVKVSDKASIYSPETISLGDFSRIDDFCVVSGKVSIGRYCHITPMCLVSGGVPGVFLSDFCTLAYGVKVFAQSDDYSGETMVNSLVPPRFKNEYLAEVVLERQVIVGAGSTIFPGVTIKEGCAIGAMSLVRRSTLPWGIYGGVPARRIKDRMRGILSLEESFLKEMQ
ncbi:MAG: acyltransferase [Alcanivorax sp.]|nr:acyltransferase [Alcanivorax sp.]